MFLESAEGEEMGVSEVGDMDVVTDTGAVGGRVVVAIDADGGTAAEGDVEDERNEMRLGLMVFSADDAGGAFGSAGDVSTSSLDSP